MKTTLIFLRHGQSLGNATRSLLGHTDLGLSELGYKQAKLAARSVAGRKIDKIYSSDLIRAVQTAEPSAKALGLEVHSTPDFREIYLGDWEGVSCEALAAANDPIYLIDFKDRFGYFRAPGGESAEELGLRIYKMAEKYAVENEGKTLLIACHAAAIRTLCGRVLGYGKDGVSRQIGFPDNASLTTLEYQDGAFKLISYSEPTYTSEELSQ